MWFYLQCLLPASFFSNYLQSENADEFLRLRHSCALEVVLCLADKQCPLIFLRFKDFSKHVDCQQGHINRVFVCCISKLAREPLQSLPNTCIFRCSFFEETSEVCELI